MTVLAVLIGWAVLSVPVALLLARMFAAGRDRNARLATPPRRSSAPAPERVNDPPTGSGARGLSGHSA